MVRSVERPVVLRPLLLASPPWAAPLRPVLRCAGIRTPRNSRTLRFERHRQRIRRKFVVIGGQRHKDLVHDKKRSLIRKHYKSDIIVFTRKLSQQRLKEERRVFVNPQCLLDDKEHDILLRLKEAGFVFFVVFIKKHKLQQAGNFRKQFIFNDKEQLFEEYGDLQPSFFLRQQLQKTGGVFRKQKQLVKLPQQFIFFRQLQKRQFFGQLILPQQFVLIIGKLPQFRLILRRRQPLVGRKLRQFVFIKTQIKQQN